MWFGRYCFLFIYRTRYPTSYGAAYARKNLPSYGGQARTVRFLVRCSPIGFNAFYIVFMNFSEFPYEVNDLVRPCGWLEIFTLVRWSSPYEKKTVFSCNLRTPSCLRRILDTMIFFAPATRVTLIVNIIIVTT